jgi:D-alanine-D-alanine ligase
MSEPAARPQPSRVVVLAGGLSHERDVSVRSGRRVAEALRSAGFDVDERDMDAALLPALTDDPPVCVFPVLHGAAGEDGAIRDVLELLGLPYVGSSPTACRTAYDKPLAKSLLARAGVATPDAIVLPHATFRELGASAVLSAVEKSHGLPLVVKPTKCGSALGATIVRSPDELPGAMVACFSYGDTAILERYVEGTEVAVTVIDLGDGPVALPAVEIVPDGGFYDYTARYTAGMTEFFVPARLDEALSAAVADVALTAHEVLGLSALSRSDLIVDADGVVQFLEVNVAPGMTETSLVPQAVEAAGLDLGEVCAALVRDAVS